MPTIKLEIDSCLDCPYLRESKIYTGDSFEDIQEWECAKAHGKSISKSVEWNCRPTVPDWCPILVK